MVFFYEEILKIWETKKPQGRANGKTFWLAIKNAIEKQISIRPKIVTTKEVPYTHRLGRLLYFYCPKCGKFLLGIYETDPQRGGGISRDMRGCPRCLQAIDFTEWYHQEEDLILEE